MLLGPLTLGRTGLALTLEPDRSFLWLPVFTEVAFAFHKGS